MRVELEQLRNERDHLRDNVIPQLQQQQQQPPQSTPAPESSEIQRLLGEIESLKIENASLAQLQGKVRGSQHNINVTYYDNRQQAVVMGGGQDYGGQSHTTGAKAVARRPAMPGSRPHNGQAMPVASGARQARLSNAWGKVRSALGLG